MDQSENPESKQENSSNELNSNDGVGSPVVSGNEREQSPQQPQINDQGSSQVSQQFMPAPQQVEPQQQVASTQVVYQNGCVGAAWGDIRKSKGWFGKVALMGLVELIPILNWFNAGYAMRWGRDLFFGRIGEMPQSIFADRSFVNGAMCFLLQLVVGVVTWIVAWVITLALGFIPLLGTLVSIAIAVIVSMFLNIMVMRVAIFDEVGVGFGISQVASVAKEHYGSLFAIWFLPGFITALIAFVLSIVILSINGALVGANTSNYLTMLITQYGSEDALYHALSTNSRLAGTVGLVLINYFFSLMPGLLIVFYVVAVCSVLSQLVAIRAAGHFCARWATEWKDDPRFDLVMTRERI